MKRKRIGKFHISIGILPALLCGLLTLGFLGCQKRQAERNQFEEDAIQLEVPVTYRNKYLGIIYTIPSGWWLYDLNSSNFNTDGMGTEDSITLDIIYGDDYSLIELVSFANLQSSSKDNHLGFEVAAESREDSSSIQEYMPHFEEFILQKTKNQRDVSSSLLESGVANISGKDFEKRVFEVFRPRDTYRILTLTAPVKDGYFLNIMVNYWPNNKNAQTAIVNAVDKALIFDVGYRMMFPGLLPLRQRFPARTRY